MIITMLDCLIIILVILKWRYYLKKNQIKVKYIRPAVLAVSLYCGVIGLTVLVERKIHVEAFGIYTLLFWVSGMIIFFIRGIHFLTVMEKFYPSFMRKFNMQKYDISILYKNKFADFEKELERINENGIDVVKEVILQRKLFIPMLIMYWETIILMAGLLFPSRII